MFYRGDHFTHHRNLRHPQYNQICNYIQTIQVCLHNLSLTSSYWCQVCCIRQYLQKTNKGVSF